VIPNYKYAVLGSCNGSCRSMMKACSDLGRLLRTIPPLLHDQVGASCMRSHSSFSSAAFRHGHNKSSLPSSPVSRRETLGGLSVPLNCVALDSASRVFSIGFYSNCTRSIDEMANRRDPASEQLNDYQKKYQVRGELVSLAYSA